MEYSNKTDNGIKQIRTICHKDDKSAGRLVAVVITFIVYSLVKKTMKPNFKV